MRFYVPWGSRVSIAGPISSFDDNFLPGPIFTGLGALRKRHLCFFCVIRRFFSSGPNFYGPPGTWVATNLEFSWSVCGPGVANLVIYHASGTSSGHFFQKWRSRFYSHVVLGGLVHVRVFRLRFYVPPGTWVSPSIVKIRPIFHGYLEFQFVTLNRDPFSKRPSFGLEAQSGGQIKIHFSHVPSEIRIKLN